MTPEAREALREEMREDALQREMERAHVAHEAEVREEWTVCPDCGGSVHRDEAHEHDEGRCVSCHRQRTAGWFYWTGSGVGTSIHLVDPERTDGPGIMVLALCGRVKVRRHSTRRTRTAGQWRGKLGPALCQHCERAAEKRAGVGAT